MMVKVGEDLRERTRGTRYRENGSNISVFDGVARRGDASGKCDNNDSNKLEHVSLLKSVSVSPALMTQPYTPPPTNATARGKIFKTWNKGYYKFLVLGRLCFTILTCSDEQW